MTTRTCKCRCRVPDDGWVSQYNADRLVYRLAEQSYDNLFNDLRTKRGISLQCEGLSADINNHPNAWVVANTSVDDKRVEAMQYNA